VSLAWAPMVKAPPSVLVELIGAKQAAKTMHALGLPVPRILESMDSGAKLSGEIGNIGRFFIAK